MRTVDPTAAIGAVTFPSFLAAQQANIIDLKVRIIDEKKRRQVG